MHLPKLTCQQIFALFCNLIIANKGTKKPTQQICALSLNRQLSISLSFEESKRRRYCSPYGRKLEIPFTIH